eukprot:g3282.t1
MCPRTFYLRAIDHCGVEELYQNLMITKTLESSTDVKDNVESIHKQSSDGKETTRNPIVPSFRGSHEFHKFERRVNGGTVRVSHIVKSAVVETGGRHVMFSTYSLDPEWFVEEYGKHCGFFTWNPQSKPLKIVCVHGMSTLSEMLSDDDDQNLRRTEDPKSIYLSKTHDSRRNYKMFKSTNEREGDLFSIGTTRLNVTPTLQKAKAKAKTARGAPLPIDRSSQDRESLAGILGRTPNQYEKAIFKERKERARRVSGLSKSRFEFLHCPRLPFKSKESGKNSFGFGGGVHHSKFIIIAGDKGLFCLIMTANLTPSHSNDHVWCQVFPRRVETIDLQCDSDDHVADKANGDPQGDLRSHPRTLQFRETMIHYIEELSKTMGISERWLLKGEGRKKRIDGKCTFGAREIFSQYDFSNVCADLIVSIPGCHRSSVVDNIFGTAAARYGRLRLETLLNTVPNTETLHYGSTSNSQDTDTRKVNVNDHMRSPSCTSGKRPREIRKRKSKSNPACTEIDHTMLNSYAASGAFKSVASTNRNVKDCRLILAPTSLSNCTGNFLSMLVQSYINRNACRVPALQHTPDLELGQSTTHLLWPTKAFIDNAVMPRISTDLVQWSNANKGRQLQYSMIYCLSALGFTVLNQAHTAQDILHCVSPSPLLQIMSRDKILSHSKLYLCLEKNEDASSAPRTLGDESASCNNDGGEKKKTENQGIALKENPSKISNVQAVNNSLRYIKMGSDCMSQGAQGHWVDSPSPVGTQPDAFVVRNWEMALLFRPHLNSEPCLKCRSAQAKRLVMKKKSNKRAPTWDHVQNETTTTALQPQATEGGENWRRGLCCYTVGGGEDYEAHQCSLFPVHFNLPGPAYVDEGADGKWLKSKEPFMHTLDDQLVKHCLPWERENRNSKRKRKTLFTDDLLIDVEQRKQKDDELEKEQEDERKRAREERRKRELALQRLLEKKRAEKQIEETKINEVFVILQRIRRSLQGKFTNWNEAVKHLQKTTVVHQTGSF